MSVLLDMRQLVVVAAVSLMAAVPLSGGMRMQPEQDDPNALADGMMSFMMNVYWGDVGRYPPEEHDPPAGEQPKPPAETPKDPPPRKPIDETPNLQPEVVVINGDSSDPVDEVMDEPGTFFLRPISVLSAPPALSSPLAVASGLHDSALRLRVFSPRGLSPDEARLYFRSEFVVTPVGGAARRNLERRLADMAIRGSGVHVTTATLRSYCVVSAKLPATPDTLFVVASRATQEQFAPAMRFIPMTAEFGAAHGFLRPQGEVAAYGRFMSQYGVWTKLEHWDQARFTKEFIARTRQEMTAAKKPWTNETEQTLRVLAPARWRDVQLVIRAADIVQTKRRAASAAR